MTVAPRHACRWGAIVALLVGAVSHAHGSCRRTCGDELVVCKRTRCAGEHGAARRDCLDQCQEITGCGGGIGTLAYVVSTCHVQGDGLIGTQELRIRRGGCDPISVMRFSNPGPVADPLGLCTAFSQNHSGSLSSLGGVFQRLGVSQDGSTVVFEVSNQFELIGRTALTDDQQGFFAVKADGTGLRRVGSPSRDPVYRVFRSNSGGVGGYSAGVQSELPFSLDGTTIGYTDIGPGMGGKDTAQVFTLQLSTGERRQLTQLDPAPPPSPTDPSGHRILWIHFVSPDALAFTKHEGDSWKSMQVDLDGTNLIDTTATLTTHLPAGDGHVARSFGLGGGRGIRYGEVWTSGLADDGDVFPGNPPPREIFRLIGSHVLQLTNLRFEDTRILDPKLRGVLFMSSANPFGTNPFNNCNVFHVSALGNHLRQLTQFGTGVRSEKGCDFGSEPGCGVSGVPRDWTSSPALAFYSDCDPFGANPNGSQVFAIDYNGSRFRQITHTAGVQRAADGSLELEMPGPVAAGGH